MFASCNVDKSVYCISWSRMIRYNIDYRYSIQNHGSSTLQKAQSVIIIVVINHSVGALQARALQNSILPLLESALNFINAVRTYIVSIIGLQLNQHRAFISVCYQEKYYNYCQSIICHRFCIGLRSKLLDSNYSST